MKDVKKIQEAKTWSSKYQESETSPRLNYVTLPSPKIHVDFESHDFSFSAKTLQWISRFDHVILYSHIKSHNSVQFLR